MMRRILIAIVVLGLAAWQGAAWAGDAAAKAEACTDCHEASDFEGMDAAAIVSGSKEASANNKMMAKATADVSDEDLQAIAAYLAADATK